MRNNFKAIYFGTVILLVIGILTFWYVRWAIFRPNSLGEQEVEIRIESGMGASQIAELLYSKKLVSSATLFKAYVKYKKFTLQAGNYKLQGNKSIAEIASELRLGRDDTVVTVIEGLRAEEVAELLSKSLENVDYEEFMKLVRDNKLEGKLFPDTYDVNAQISTKEIIFLLTETFKEKVSPVLAKNKTGLSEEEVLILASIVEREEPTTKERPTVAGILLNRLIRGEVLGADASVQYVVGANGNWWPKELTIEDLAIDSPYNTRKNAGLPPKPISSPGISAIDAVVNHVDTDFNFYLHDKNGEVHYAKTIEEHIQNVGMYLR